MSVLEYFHPETVKTFKSDINDDVELIRFMGELRLDMGGLTQSGGVIEKIWSKALNDLTDKNFQPKTVLLLGLGAGSALKVIRKKYKDAKITAIEIDPVVIDIAKNYFSHVNDTKTNVICEDAVDFLEYTPDSFDLVIVDCYQGYKVPKKLNSVSFIRKIKSQHGLVLINRLFWAEFKKPATEFLTGLSKFFDTKTTRTASNLLIAVKNSKVHE